MLNKTVGEVVNEILMLHAVKPGFSFLAVEGGDDVRFWEPRTHPACEVINATSKSVGQGAVRRLNARGFVGHLGVFDRDYDDIHAISNWNANEIYWDAHSLETVLFFSSAFEKLVSEEIGQAQRTSAQAALGQDIKTLIEDIAKTIGAIRYVHRLSGSQGDPDRLSPFRHVNPANSLVDVASIYVEGVSIGASPSVAQLRIAIADYADLNPRLLMRGHDVAAVISITIRYCGGSCTNKRAEEILRIGFERSELEQTSVYAEIRNWEVARSPRKILS
jgi:hypothetical protein